MRTIRNSFIGSVLFFCLTFAQAGIISVPAVQKWSPGKGQLEIGSPTVKCAPSAPEEYKTISDMFARELEQVMPEAADKQAKSTFTFTVDTCLEAEAYIIDIDKTVTIKSSGPQGAFYASQTLLQMLAAAEDGTLPYGTIEDKPLYPIRSVMVDVGRKFMPMEQLKDWIRMMARLKLNELHFHLNDNCRGRYAGYRLESRKFPELPSKDGYYTWQQIRELQDFAAIRGISIVPEIDSPGHSLAFTTLRPDLAHPGLDHSNIGIGLCCLDIRKDETYRFMEAILDEVVPLFDSKYFHIGTDEYPMKLLPNDEERNKTGELFRQYINHFARYVKDKYGKTPRIWSGYEHMPGTTEPDKSIVIDMWETTDAVNKSRAGYSFVNASHFYTYIVPGKSYYGVDNQFIYDIWTPLIFNLKEENSQLGPDDPGLLGGKLHVWNDPAPTGYTWNEIARLTQPSMEVFSEKLWGTKGSADYTEFQKRATVIDCLPQIPLLIRTVKADQNGVVFARKGQDIYFISNTYHPLSLPGDAKNLEYPWTASFTLTHLSDAIEGEVLLSSELATFYLDLTHSTTDKKTKETTTQRGVSCVRAIRAPGYNPLTSYNPDVLVFDYQVPLNQKVTLTFVGEQKKTSLYVDGKLIESKEIQMVCPLEFIGSSQRQSFQGILHEIIISNKAVR